MKLTTLLFVFLVSCVPCLAQTTVEDWRREAVKEHPALGLAGSPLNTAFVAEYQRRKADATAQIFFTDPKWPIVLADACAQKLAGVDAAQNPSPASATSIPQPTATPAPPPVLQPAESPHLGLGNPSHATTDIAQKDNFLLVKDIYALSFNNTKGTPNWVSWLLVKEDLGTSPRFPFTPDFSLPAGFNVIFPTDYTNSGFDRGHMCPHGDRSLNDVTSKTTFLMSNMVPQSPANNQKCWEELEVYCRDLVKNQGKQLYIVDGPVGMGGEGRNGKMDNIGHQHSVTVPAKTWKVIAVLDVPPQPVADPVQLVNANTRLIAVMVPNDMSVTFDWRPFRVSVREVEKATGLTFFDRVPGAIINPLKDKVDSETVTIIKLDSHP